MAEVPQTLTEPVRTVDGKPATVIRHLLDKTALPMPVIPVAYTAGFPNSGNVSIQVATDSWTTVAYTGITENSLTGCTGGTGVLVPGLLVISEPSPEQLEEQRRKAAEEEANRRTEFAKLAEEEME